MQRVTWVAGNVQDLQDTLRVLQGFRAGGGGLGSGFVVDVTLRRALVCRAPPG